jgi:NADH:ubiquinone oxidoreductase subunit 6 (subunit J)
MFIDILIILIILFSFIVILLNNTVYSILSLILVFFLSSILLLSYGLDYLSLIFITIYVGALSVLFLFVIMMLNIKTIEKKLNLHIIMMFIILYFLLDYFNFINIFLVNWNIVFSNVSIKTNVILTVGNYIFTEYFILLILSGIILFIAMVGSVSLVLELPKNTKNQIIYQQISRNCTNSVFKVRTI